MLLWTWVGSPFFRIVKILGIQNREYKIRHSPLHMPLETSCRRGMVTRHRYTLPYVPFAKDETGRPTPPRPPVRRECGNCSPWFECCIHFHPQIPSRLLRKSSTCQQHGCSSTMSPVCNTPFRDGEDHEEGEGIIGSGVGRGGRRVTISMYVGDDHFREQFSTHYSCANFTTPHEPLSHQFFRPRYHIFLAIAINWSERTEGGERKKEKKTAPVGAPVKVTTHPPSSVVEPIRRIPPRARAHVRGPRRGRCGRAQGAVATWAVMVQHGTYGVCT